MKQILTFLSVIALSTASLHAETMTNQAGTTVDISADHGDFTISTKSPTWSVGGTIGMAVSNIKTSDGKDTLGEFHSIHFEWQDHGKRTGAIRLYANSIVFSETFIDAVNGSPTPFPILSKLPADLHPFRFGEEHLRPEQYDLALKKPMDPDQYGGPFAFFDDNANTMILSPANDFMVAMLAGNQKDGITSGLNRTMKSVPAGYVYETMLTIGHGIHDTWHGWGHDLNALHDVKRPANDADTGLKYLGYWTDNGAAYYYNYDLARGYEGTLLEIKKHLDDAGIPIHYLQLDSWWYPKTFNSVQTSASNKPRAKDPKLPAGTWNRYGGLLEYTAHPDLFPNGLAAFDQKLGLPLITHNRWIDPESPYHAQYKISGIAAVDPAFWNKIISDIASWGVKTYEQDWSNYIYNRSPELSSTTWAGEAMMDGMASACAAHGLTMQYCMVLPRHVMQGATHYPNFTTVRVSGDRLDRGKWRDFIYGSTLASALQVWPWTDVFKSKETPNVLISSLSAGMVGLSDTMGEENAENIFRAVRKDGMIVKPDESLTPVDASFISEANGKSAPIVCAARTLEGTNDPIGYVFAFNQKPEAGNWAIDPKTIGISHDAFAYDFFNGSGHKIAAGEALSSALNEDGWSYWIIVPVGPSKMALVGDVGKFATRGKQRVATVQEAANRLIATLSFAPGESKTTIGIYSPTKPNVAAKGASLGEVKYDETTGFATVDVSPEQSATTGDLTLTFEAK